LLNEQGKVAYEGKAYSQNIVDICLGQISWRVKIITHFQLVMM
jgi:hypothetical protein